MGQGQGCCGGNAADKQESNLLAAAKNGMTTPGINNKNGYNNNKLSKEAFFKRQSTSLDIVGSSIPGSSRNVNMNAFYGNLVISCTGRGACHSKFSKLCLNIQQNVGSGTYDDSDYSDLDEDNKENNCKFTQEERSIIRGALWTKSEKLRKYFILLLENTENDDKYMDLYNNLNDESYKINDKNAIFILQQFVKIIENDDEYLLQCLANVTCSFGSRPLWNEIIENTKDNDDLNEEAILDKVEEVHKTKFYQNLRSKGVELADNEILAVYIYTVNNEFADLMQKNLKIPCKWKQTFYYFVRGILKIYDSMVYNKKLNKLPKCLYHPIFGQSRVEAPFQMLSTVNCTENEDGAKDLAPPDGTMYVFENVSGMLSKGKLIGAPIDWISHNPDEKEWVLLPLRVLKINSNKLFSVEKNCKEITITKYQTFNATLYGVDIFGKLGTLKFVKDILSTRR